MTITCRLEQISPRVFGHWFSRSNSVVRRKHSLRTNGYFNMCFDVGDKKPLLHFSYQTIQWPHVLVSASSPWQLAVLMKRFISCLCMTVFNIEPTLINIHMSTCIPFWHASKD